MLKFENVKEKSIKPLLGGGFLLDGLYYNKVGSVVDRKNKNVVSLIDNLKINLTRIDAYIFKDELNNHYFIYGNDVYKKTGKECINDSSEPYFFEINSEKMVKDVCKDSLIEGDNLAALELMVDKYEGKIDFISIDPPYNTRNKDMRYNDFFPIIGDNDKHSSWLSFMNKRLIIAKKLLSNDGIIFINIDEFEYPYLKILCDQIFDDENLIETFIWEKNSTKNNSKTTSNNHEYILCYAKNKKKVEGLGYFRKRKEGVDEVNAIIDSVRNSDVKNKAELAQKLIRDYYSKNKNLKGIKQYKFVDDKLNVYRISDVSAPSGGGLLTDVIHPLTGKVCKNPAGGYRYKLETLKKHLENNRIHFGKDENTVPQYKRFLSEVETEVFKSVIKNTDEGKKDLEKIFGVSPFNNSKPVSLLKSLISMINKKEMICLDFFAGSGSLGHAVVEYNKERLTNHSFILITNNESNIFYDVLLPRMESMQDKKLNVYKIIYK